MTIKYQLQTTPYGEAIISDNDGVISVIPIDPANSDYQRYLRWLENPDAEEGGTL